MSNDPVRIFIDSLFHFCFQRHGVAWQTARRPPVIYAGALFNATIGNAVLSTIVKNPFIVNAYTYIFWRYIRDVHAFENISFDIAYRIVDAVARDIYSSYHFIDHTYMFLAVMINVAKLCISKDKEQLIFYFIDIVPSVLDDKILGGFQRNFHPISMSAFFRALPILD